MLFNCCQQPGLCSENKICKTFNSPTKPWKRFTCECPAGYHGNDCQTPITSCQGYAKISGKSGMYKLVDSVDNSLYEVYCHFESGSAWTLVLSSSHKNTGDVLKISLSQNWPMNENALTWSSYRLRKNRMQSIKGNSTFVQLSCDFEKHYDIQKLDHVQMPLESFENGNIADILEIEDNYTPFADIDEGRGRIGGNDLYGCRIRLHQKTNRPLHVHFKKSGTGPSGCTISNFPCSSGGRYFDSYLSISCGDECDCDNIVHRCVQNNLSTTQLWFGTPVYDGATESA